MSAEKYSSWTEYAMALMKRVPIRALIRPLAKWRPLSDPEKGYTIVIACHRRFPEMLLASLKLLYRDELPNLRETIIVIDGPSTGKLKSTEERFLTTFPRLNIRFIYQTWFQSRISRLISWGWVDCWLSYCAGLAATRTKVAMLHDMDAMMVKSGLIEERYRQFVESHAEFMGYLWYNANGINPEMEICVIVEMFIDAQHLRSRFKPIDVFNRIGVHRGVRLDFDTLLYPQVLSARRIVRKIGEGEMVHPSQVISQFTYLANSKNYIPPAGNNLFFIPYFLHIANGDGALRELAGAIRECARTQVVPFYGYRMNMSRLPRDHFRWICKQVFRIEYSFAGKVRPEVSEYLSAIGQTAHVNDVPGMLDEVTDELGPEKGWLIAQFPANADRC
jgi:hypothetical protein